MMPRGFGGYDADRYMTPAWARKVWWREVPKLDVTDPVAIEHLVESYRRVIDEFEERHKSIAIRTTRAPSPIHGTGVFSLQSIPIGGRFSIHRTYSGDAGLNHSCRPNSRILPSGINEALEDIEIGDEITVSYGDTPELTGHTCNCGKCYS